MAKHFPDIPVITGLSAGATADTDKIVQYNSMSGVYDKCFMGIRLTPHDGLPNTVVELGLMGRRCVWNGNLPNAIPWMKDADIIEAVSKEKDRIGQSFPDIRASMLNHISIGDEWLDTGYYENWKSKCQEMRW